MRVLWDFLRHACQCSALKKFDILVAFFTNLLAQARTSMKYISNSHLQWGDVATPLNEISWIHIFLTIFPFWIMDSTFNSAGAWCVTGLPNFGFGMLQKPACHARLLIVIIGKYNSSWRRIIQDGYYILFINFSTLLCAKSFRHLAKISVTSVTIRRCVTRDTNCQTNEMVQYEWKTACFLGTWLCTVYPVDPMWYSTCQQKNRTLPKAVVDVQNIYYVALLQLPSRNPTFVF